jgi:hypothetical protein
MTVLEILIGSPRNHDGLDVFLRERVQLFRTSLTYHLLNTFPAVLDLQQNLVAAMVGIAWG